jgi:5-formyltetrahydrofolate cyclo-ligase
VIFDPETEAALKHRAKIEIRKRMRALRNSIPAKAREARSEKVVKRVAESSPFEHSSSLALFYPSLEKNEVDVRPLDAIARELGKRIAYPFLEETPGEMTLRLAEPASLEERGHGFLEPPPGSPELVADEGLLIIVPALAVATSGHRIGYGKGFYDRLLARVSPPARAMAVAFDFQVLAEIPVTETDRAVHWVMTDLRTWDPSKEERPT